MHVFRWLTIFGLIICAATSGPAAWAQGKINLTFNPEPGTYVMVQTLISNTSVIAPDGQAAKGQSRTIMTMEATLGKADARGNRDMKLTFRRIQMEDQPPNGRETVNYDSDKGKSREPGLSQMFDAIINKPFSITLDSKGDLRNAQPLNVQIDSAVAGVALSSDEIKKRIAHSLSQFQSLPGRPVAKGNSWNEVVNFTLPMLDAMPYTQTNTLGDIQNGVATVTTKGTLTKESKHPDGPPGEVTTVRVNMTLDGVTLVDVATGMTKSATVTQKGSMTVFAGGTSMKATFDNKTDFTVTKGAYAAKTAKPTANATPKKTETRKEPPGAITLAFNPEPGYYVMKQEAVTNTTVVVNGHSESAQVRAVVTVEMSFGPANAAGKRNVKLVYRRAQLEASSGGRVHQRYDSANRKSATNSDSTYDALIGNVISATLDANGNPIDIKGLDELIAASMKEEPEDSTMSDQEQAEFEQCIRQKVIEESFGRFRLTPGKSVARDDSWEMDATFSHSILRIMPLVQTCTLTDVRDDKATITVKAMLTEDGKPLAVNTKHGRNSTNMLVTGTALVDVATGLTMSETMAHKGRLTLNTSDGDKWQVTADGTTNRTITKGAYKAPK